MSLFKDSSLLIARILLGIVLIAHGWQKFNEWGLAGTADAFSQMGVPLPSVAAFIAAAVELVGGILILIGLATPWVGTIVALQMFGAFIFAHTGAGVFVADGGFELVAVIAAAGLALAGASAGRFSVDALLNKSKQAA